MLQYINWLWGGQKKTYNFDKLRRMIAVYKIECTYLKYRSKKRIIEKKDTDINLYIKNIKEGSNQLENNINVTSKSEKKRNRKRDRNRNKNKNNRLK